MSFPNLFTVRFQPGHARANEVVQSVYRKVAAALVAMFVMVADAPEKGAVVKNANTDHGAWFGFHLFWGFAGFMVWNEPEKPRPGNSHSRP